MNRNYIDIDDYLNNIISNLKIIDENQEFNPMELKNDVQIKKKRMRKMKHKKMLKRNANLFKKRQIKKEIEEKAEFQKQVLLLKKMAEGFDPKQKAERFLNLARRGGFYIDILKSEEK